MKTPDTFYQMISKVLAQDDKKESYDMLQRANDAIAFISSLDRKKCCVTDVSELIEKCNDLIRFVICNATDIYTSDLLRLLQSTNKYVDYI